MPVIVTVITILATAAWWFFRVRGVSRMTMTALDAAADVPKAIRRNGFKSKAGQHPLETIDDPETLIATTAAAFVSTDGVPDREARNRVSQAIQDVLPSKSHSDAEELVTSGFWLADQCTTPQAAINRASKRLYKTSQGTYFNTLVAVLQRSAGDTPLSDSQKDSLRLLQSAFRLT